MLNMLKAGRVPALLVASALMVTPAAAAEMPLLSPCPIGDARLDAASWQKGDEIYQGYRRYGYRRYGHRRGGIDAGDVIAGVTILGGIAAIVSAASRRNDRDYRYPDPREDDRYVRDDARGLDRAVSICVSEIEREVRVADVDSVDRTALGWQVTGSLYDGAGFSCRIGSDGRIEDIDYGAASANLMERAAPGVQYDDERYLSAWADLDARESAPRTSGLPAYPGGPIDGDLEAEEIGTGYRGADR
ncbi:MAG: hypothetical protein K5799_01225 [Erythrobacter sp.]|nr:hypothetical protein [Erythrobacter sp.]